jgi:hypothetical protein
MKRNTTIKFTDEIISPTDLPAGLEMAGINFYVKLLNFFL